MKAMKPPPVTNGKAHLTSLQLWHERVGHLDHRGISEMTRKGVVHGMNISVQNANGTCEACILGKAHRYEIPKVRSTELSKGVPDLVHSDVYGPMQVPSIGGSRYGITFTDDHSHWTVTYPMREKGEAIYYYFRFKKLAEIHTGRRIRCFRIYRGGGEYLSNELKRHFSERGIDHQLTTAYSPHQNGVAERKAESYRTEYHLVYVASKMSAKRVVGGSIIHGHTYQELCYLSVHYNRKDTSLPLEWISSSSVTPASLWIPMLVGFAWVQSAETGQPQLSRYLSGLRRPNQSLRTRCR